MPRVLVTRAVARGDLGQEGADGNRGRGEVFPAGCRRGARRHTPRPPAGEAADRG